MAYCNTTDLERAITAAMVLRLLDDDNDGTVDSAVATDLIADVDAEIDGYVGRNYNLTILKVDVPPTLRRLATDLLAQFAYQRRPEFLNDRGETPWEGRYRRALAKLKELRDGLWRLDIDADPADPANVDGAVYQGTSDTYPDGIGCGVWSEGFGDF